MEMLRSSEAVALNGTLEPKTAMGMQFNIVATRVSSEQTMLLVIEDDDWSSDVVLVVHTYKLHYEVVFLVEEERKLRTSNFVEHQELDRCMITTCVHKRHLTYRMVCCSCSSCGLCACLSACLAVCLYVCLSLCLSVILSMYL